LVPAGKCGGPSGSGKSTFVVIIVKNDSLVYLSSYPHTISCYIFVRDITFVITFKCLYQTYLQ
jgi:hypothetical protein